MNEIFEEVKRDLSVNFNANEVQVLQRIIDKVIANALFISNRSNNEDNIELLKPEIEECVKTIYLQRGTEDVLNQSQSGLSNTFKNAMETLRNDIILNGKRIIK